MELAVRRRHASAMREVILLMSQDHNNSQIPQRKSFLLHNSFAFKSKLIAIMAERRVAQIAGHLFPQGMLAGQVRCRHDLTLNLQHSIDPACYRLP